MLSKKQARAFFLGGTVVTFLIFIGLTIFSFSKSQDQTNHEGITEQVVRGKVLWEENNCMGCHTILGEGAYYAPELTKVLDRRGEGYVKAVLMSPIPWNPNGRKMVAYGFTKEEADDLIAFFDWIGGIDLNGFDTVVSPLAKDKIERNKN
ncbi:c-type cytochrome [Xanthomarina spongicola]|uniref:Nitric oxide reductase subunit C n=1 Tax=Xanthomarina spongicola TaxID=570520 RepID=A0A316DTK9_9FLAO|nr:cytochrome c [Xanthomarina spongicola]PWK20762.1 nitric oxide reductase subunit C [Xanthomarina spongicola]